MRFQRSAGVLLHISSLSSRGGIGDLGPEAYRFLDFLADARQHIWQVLPLCPTGYGNSPYAGSSAFAGNPLLVSLELLSTWGWMDPAQLAVLPGPHGNVDFETVAERKQPLLELAARNFLSQASKNPELADQWRAYQQFWLREAHWLDDYALYAVLRRHYNTGAWNAWPEELKRRVPKAVAHAREQFATSIAVEKVLQFAFEQQWNLLREAARKRKIRILGDIAIFVSMDSSDVWANPHLFQLDDQLAPTAVAGVPPDYFSPTGQRWGNPLYRWDVLADSGYKWWAERLGRACAQYDLVRLDHFRGFEAYWSVPADEETAINGQWVKAPGADFFHQITAQLGPLPLVAEDLGVITPEVEALRLAAGMPGMRVLQFGFGSVEAHNHLPHMFTPDSVVYTGTHDNDTSTGWWRTADAEEKGSAQAYLGPVGFSPVWQLMRAAASSVAEIAIVPAQDLLELGSEARMNTPAVATGNWSWRAPVGAWHDGLARGLAHLALMTDRDNDPLAAPVPDTLGPVSV